MPRISRPATHKGDDGTTENTSGERVSKTAPEICVYGALDELNSAIGVTLSLGALSAELIEPLEFVQNALFHLGAGVYRMTPTELDSTHPGIEERHIRHLDDIIDHLYQGLGPLKNFALPGGTPSAASLHMARAVCRRAEREVVALSGSVEVDVLAIKYLNRLSDALFLMARSENKRHETNEPVWDSYH